MRRKLRKGEEGKTEKFRGKMDSAQLPEIQQSTALAGLGQARRSQRPRAWEPSTGTASRSKIKDFGGQRKRKRKHLGHYKLY